MNSISWRKLWRRSSNDYVVIPWSMFVPLTSLRRCWCVSMGIWFKVIRCSIFPFLFILIESRSEDCRASSVLLAGSSCFDAAIEKEPGPKGWFESEKSWALWALILRRVALLVHGDRGGGYWGSIGRSERRWSLSHVQLIELRESVCYAVVDALPCCYPAIVTSSDVSPILYPVVARVCVPMWRGVPSQSVCVCVSWKMCFLPGEMCFLPVTWRGAPPLEDVFLSARVERSAFTVRVSVYLLVPVVEWTQGYQIFWFCLISICRQKFNSCAKRTSAWC